MFVLPSFLQFLFFLSKDGNGVKVAFAPSPHLLSEEVANSPSKTMGLAKFLPDFVDPAVSFFFHPLCASCCLDFFFTKLSSSLLCVKPG